MGVSGEIKVLTWGLSSSILLPKGFRYLPPPNAFKPPGMSSLTMNTSPEYQLLQNCDVGVRDFCCFLSSPECNFYLPNRLPCAEILKRVVEVQGMLRFGLQYLLCCNRVHSDPHCTSCCTLQDSKRGSCVCFWGWHFYRRKLGKGKEKGKCFHLWTKEKCSGYNDV